MAQHVSRIVGSDVLMDKLAPILGIDPRMVTRIIIDMRPGDPVFAYVQMIVSSKILELEWPPLDNGMAVKIADAPAPVIPPYNGDKG